MKSKKAIIIVELIDESTQEDDQKIKVDLLEWFRENVNFIPWAKYATEITVKDP